MDQEDKGSADTVKVEEIDVADVEKDEATGKLSSGKCSRIEIVNWGDQESEDSSHDQNSNSQTISLEQLMMGAEKNLDADPAKGASPANNRADSGDEKLTIDNLWKILANEKAVTDPVHSRMPEKNRSKSRT